MSVSDSSSRRRIELFCPSVCKLVPMEASEDERLDLGSVARTFGLDPSTLKINGHFISRGRLDFISPSVTWKSLLSFFSSRGFSTGTQPHHPLIVDGKRANNSSGSEHGGCQCTKYSGLSLKRKSGLKNIDVLKKQRTVNSKPGACGPSDSENVDHQGTKYNEFGLKRKQSVEDVNLLKKKKMNEDHSANSSAATISANVNITPKLTGTNFKEWKGHLLIVLGCMDLDLALREEQPAPLTADSTTDAKNDLERWERSNRMSLMIMKHNIPEAFRGTKSDEITTAKDFLEVIEKRFAKNDKVEMITLLTSLMNKKYKGQGNVREYIMEMFHIASRLKGLKIEFSEELLVLMVLVSLPHQFNQFKVTYDCQKEKWTLNELISHCVLEEDRLKQDKSESVHYVSASKDKDKGKKRKIEKTEKENAEGPTQKKQQQAKDVCFFCDKPGHVKKDCPKYHVWRVKKGLPELPKSK